MKDLIEYEQYLKASWFNEMGLDANYNMKRERISNGEVNQNSDALIPFMQNMLNSRKGCVENVNKLFGLNISVELSSVWENVMQESTTDPTEDNSKRLENTYNAIIGSEGNNNDETE